MTNRVSVYIYHYSPPLRESKASSSMGPFVRLTPATFLLFQKIIFFYVKDQLTSTSLVFTGENFVPPWSYILCRKYALFAGFLHFVVTLSKPSWRHQNINTFQILARSRHSYLFLARQENYRATLFFKNLACNLRQQQMQFHAKYPLFNSQPDCEFTFSVMRLHAKYPIFDSQSDRELNFSYAILWKLSVIIVFQKLTNHSWLQLKDMFLLCHKKAFAASKKKNVVWYSEDNYCCILSTGPPPLVDLSRCSSKLTGWIFFDSNDIGES